MLACTWESILLIEETVDARDLDAHELFSGAEAITKAHVLLGLTCLGQDKCKDEREDVIQSAGLTLAIWRALRTKKGRGGLGCNGLQHGFVDRKRLDRTNQNNTQRSCAHDASAGCKLHDWGNHAGAVTALASRCAYCWGKPDQLSFGLCGAIEDTAASHPWDFAKDGDSLPGFLRCSELEAFVAMVRLGCHP